MTNNFNPSTKLIFSAGLKAISTTGDLIGAFYVNSPSLNEDQEKELKNKLTAHIVRTSVIGGFSQDDLEEALSKVRYVKSMQIVNIQKRKIAEVVDGVVC